VAKKVCEVIAILEAHGWTQVRQRGSHRQYKHSDSEYVVTIAGKSSATIPIGQLNSIRRNTGIKELR
jgi:predicted RNA binding protein YcfA (HicA-like mRNA interferase family)